MHGSAEDPVLEVQRGGLTAVGRKYNGEDSATPTAFEQELALVPTDDGLTYEGFT
jgi:hypothetical protein